MGRLGFVLGVSGFAFAGTGFWGLGFPVNGLGEILTSGMQSGLPVAERLLHSAYTVCIGVLQGLLEVCSGFVDGHWAAV